MRVLLDTHVALWTFTNDKRISSIRSLILSEDVEVFISVASSWKLAIQSEMGKIDISIPAFRQAIIDSGFIELPVNGLHTESLLSLPPCHNDPFDRMLVAQAISEPMRLITTNATLTQYGELIWPLK